MRQLTVCKNITEMKKHPSISKCTINIDDDALLGEGMEVWAFLLLYVVFFF